MSAGYALAAAVGEMPSQLLPARSQMAFTLGFHIILVPLGVVFPLLMVIANYLGLRRDDADYMRLARRWSKVAAVTFAVGAVTGTVLSFEFGMLWPGMFDRFGDVIGIAFALEGIFFFLEAIFIAIYLFGWARLSPWAHFWTGVPIPFFGLGGAFMVLAANAWMNQPGGFEMNAAGEVTSVDLWSVLFNNALPYTFAHMYVATFICAGFLVASVYALGMLRGRRDRYHRLGFLLPFTVAAIAMPIQMFVGDVVARAIYTDQPIKFAALELNWSTGPDKPEILYNQAVDLYNKNDFKGAEPILRKILEGAPEYANAHFLLGMSCVNLNKIPDMKKHLGEYLRLEPNGKEAATAKEMLEAFK